MAKHSVALAKKRWPLMLLAFISISTVMILFMRPNNSDSCNTTKTFEAQQSQIHPSSVGNAPAGPSPLDFMKSKLVLMVSHELSLSGGPLLLMELAFLLRGVGSDVVWITNQYPAEHDQVIYSLESKMLDRGVQVYFSSLCLFVSIFIVVYLVDFFSVKLMLRGNVLRGLSSFCFSIFGIMNRDSVCLQIGI